MRLQLTVAATIAGVSMLVWPNASNARSMVAAERYQIDGGHSSVIFRVMHMNVANFYGRFNDVSGQLEMDDSGAGRIEVTINVDSLDTNSQNRDKHMKGEEFFNVAEHGAITFRSNEIKKTGDDTFEAKGEITMHGQTRPLTATLKRTGAGSDPWGGYRTGYETKFTVKRSDFGMKNMLDKLGDDVDVMVSLECVREKPE